MIEVLHILEGYDTETIFNNDETGLFFRELPSYELATVAENWSEHSFQRNECFINRWKPFKIWYSPIPSCFQGKVPDGIYWKSIPKSCLKTLNFLIEYLEGLNHEMEMRRSYRSMLWIIDNEPTRHPSTYPTLTNITILCLSASYLLPCRLK